MSEQGRGQGRRSGRGHDKGRNRGYFHRDTNPEEPEPVPILTFHNSNYRDFKRKAILYVQEKYGDIYKIFEKDEYPVYEDPEYDDETFGDEFDPHGINKRIVLAELAEVRADRKALKDAKVKVYAFILSHLSKESRDAIRVSEHFEGAHDSKCPLLLWKAITQTHIIAKTGSDVYDGEKARERYYNIRQRENESLIDFKTRFSDAVDGMNVFDEDMKISQKNQAIHFILRLDDGRFKELKETLRRNAIMKVGNYPDNLNDALKVALTYNSENNTKKNHKQHQETVFHTNKAGRGRGGGRGSGRGGRGTNGKRSCWNCGADDHIRSDCPLLKAEEENNNDKDKKSVRITLSRELEKSFVTILKTNVGEELGPYDVLLDNQATTGIFHQKNLLSNIRQSEHGVEINGVNGNPLKTNICNILITE